MEIIIKSYRRMREIMAKAKTVLAQAMEKIRSMRRSASEEGMELVHEAETEEIFVTEVAKEKIRERWETIRGRAVSILGKLSPRERLVLLFAIGIIIGFGMKTAANGSLTIGYRDYTARNANAYDLIALQKKVAEGGSASAFSGGSVANGATCSQ